jgi:hypothetical protein
MTGVHGAGAAAIYDGVAVGDLARHVVIVQPFLVEEVGDLGALATQARLTSAGESTGFASTPYPGPLLLTVPGLVVSQTGVPVSPPTYPFIAASSYPATTEQDVNAGSTQLHAESDELESEAWATDGGNRTEASVEFDDDTVTARAESEVVAIDFGATFSVGGIRSSAEAKRDAAGEVQRASSFSMSSVTVLGQQLRYENGEFQFVTQRVPVGDARKPVDELFASLAEHGLSVRILGPSETPDGITSGALEITRVSDLNGMAVTTRSTFGRSFATVTSRAVGSGLDEGSETGEFADSADAALGSEPVDAGRLPDAGSAPLIEGSSSDVATGDRQPAIAASSLRPETAPAGRFYPILFLAGAVLITVLDFFRKWGVRITWTS